MIDLTPPFGQSTNFTLYLRRIVPSGGTDAHGNPDFVQQETCVNLLAKMMSASDPRNEQWGLGKDYNAYPLEILWTAPIPCNLEVGSQHRAKWVNGEIVREGTFTTQIIESDAMVDATITTLRKVSGVLRT